MTDDNDIPLDITGHEERTREREQLPNDGEGGSGANEGGERGDAERAAADADSADGDSPADPDVQDARDVLGDDLAAETGDGDDEEAEPVELLVQLAKEGEIEPWDIDIVRVTDKFLDRLDEVDLRTSGRALFYASVLLRMKSDEMIAADDTEDEPEDEESWEEWEPGEPMPGEGDGEMPAYDPVAKLEAEMDRRIERKTARGTPETLDELVRELRGREREGEAWWKDSRSYDTSDSPGTFERGTQTLDYHTGDDMRMDEEPSERDVTGTTHEEDIEAVIDEVQNELRTHYDAGRDEVLYAEIESVGGSRVQTFLALLFLSHREVVTLDQDELFGDLWVQDERTADGTQQPEAVAD